MVSANHVLQASLHLVHGQTLSQSSSPYFATLAARAMDTCAPILFKSPCWISTGDRNCWLHWVYSLFSSFLTFANPLYLVIQVSYFNDQKRTLVLQSVLVMNIISSVVSTHSDDTRIHALELRQLNYRIRTQYPRYSSKMHRSPLCHFSNPCFP